MPNPWQMLKKCISQGLTRPNYPWQRSRNAVCQGQPSHRDPGKHVKTAFARVANARSTLGNPLKIYISQGRAHPNHPWQPPQNLHLPGSTFPSSRLHPIRPFHHRNYSPIRSSHHRSYISIRSIPLLWFHPTPFPSPRPGTTKPYNHPPKLLQPHLNTKSLHPNPLITRDKFDTMG